MATTAPPETPGPAQGDVHVDAGVCFALFIYDIGLSVDLDAAERRIRAATHREFIRRKHKAPRYFQFQTPPLRATVQADRITVAGYATEPAIDFIIYDFGAVTVVYRLPLCGPLADIHRLGLELYDNEPLLADAQRRVEQLLDVIAPDIAKAHQPDVIEDYLIFQFAATTPPLDMPQAAGPHAQPLAQLLRAEAEPLSAQEIEDSLACRIAYGASDLIVIDWNAALLVGPEMDDVWAVLEFANVELLEMRFLDDQLDAALAEAYLQFSHRRWPRWWSLRPQRNVLERVARLQLDSAILFEEVNNTLKLLGDPYLARVYRLAAQRLHLAEWDASILRKLNTVESIYAKLADQQNALRMEILEWIIIILIALSMVLSLK